MDIAFYNSGSGQSPVEKFIGSLSKPDQARFKEIYDGIKEHGLNCPRAKFRQLRGKLWEIKFNSKSGGYRVLYVVITGDSMVWLHAFRKETPKTPILDLQIAEKRMQEVL